MAYQLQKPYTEKQRLDFIVEYNHRLRLDIVSTEDGTLIALEPNELYVDGNILVDENYEANCTVKYNDMLNKLTMTSLDLIQLLKSFGLSLDAIISYLNNNPELNVQLTYCKDVYCGVVRALCPTTIENVTITDAMIVEAFKSKNNIQ